MNPILALVGLALLILGVAIIPVVVWKFIIGSILMACGAILLVISFDKYRDELPGDIF